jgi:hypothetical protein
MTTHETIDHASPERESKAEELSANDAQIKQLDALVDASHAAYSDGWRVNARPSA